MKWAIRPKCKTCPNNVKDPEDTYCSLECSWQRLYKERPTCLMCPKKVRTMHNTLCSRSCSNRYKYKDPKNSPNWKGGKVMRACQICSKVVPRSRYSMKINKHIVCSRVCGGFLAHKLQKRSGSDIEVMFEKILKALAIKYESQKTFHPYTIADFYIPESNTAVFCDGDYWHSLPGAKERDQRKTKGLEAQGIRVFRFTGSQITSYFNDTVLGPKKSTAAWQFPALMFLRLLLKGQDPTEFWAGLIAKDN